MVKEKKIGKKYNETLSKIQFWTFFIGVNITFYPQHFLGYAGMPRRICDYADNYELWNKVSSYGSITTPQKGGGIKKHSVINVRIIVYIYIIWSNNK